MTNAFVENMSDILAGVAACIAVVAWLFSRTDASRKADALERYKEQAKGEVATANATAAFANESAGKANERAAGLEKEAAQLRLDLAKIDPVNLPVKSISAEVFLLVDASFFEWYFDPSLIIPDETNARFSLNSSEGVIADLKCTSFQTNPFTYRKGDTGPELECRSFTMSFSWPYTNFLTAAAPQYAFWIDRENPSVADLDKILASAEISLPPAQTALRILESQLVVTINGSIRWKFLVPNFAASATSIQCSFIKE